MSTLSEWKKKNQELIKLISYVIISAAAIVAIVSLVIYGYNLTQNKNIVIDIASGKEIDEANLGAIMDWRLALIGFEDISEKYDQDAYVDMISAIRDYLSTIHPNGKKISYIKDSLIENGDSKSFKVKVADTYDYLIQTTEGENQSINVIIKDGDSEILQYTNRKYLLKKQPLAAIDSYLPYVGYTEEGDRYNVLRRSNDGKLEIAVDNCGNSQIKARVLEHFRAWLDRNSFNPDDFSFEMPNYCDANSKA